MKKITVTALALTMAMGGFAQKKNVSMAEGYLYETPANATEAVKQIEGAMKDPTTANWSKTYYVAGQAYYKLYEDGAVKKQMGQQVDYEVSEALQNAINAYQKCIELDQQPDAKGKVKPKYTKEITKKLSEYSNYLIVEGQQYQAENKSEKAIGCMESYLKLVSSDALKSENVDKSIVTAVKYNIVGLAQNVPSKRATQIQYMNELKNIGYKQDTMYVWLSDAYKEDKQYDKMLQVLQEGIKKYPSNEYLVGNMINYYLENNKEQEAVQYCDAAIQKDPKNAQYYVIKGDLLLKKKQYDDAITNLQQAASLDPNNFNAQYECGLAYEKKGEEISDAATKIKDVKKYNAQRSKAIEEFKKSLPYFEKARQINGEDEMNLRFLRSVYYKLSMNDKYAEVDKALKAIESKK